MAVACEDDRRPLLVSSEYPDDNGIILQLSDEKKKRKKKTYEDVINQTGYGWFHYKLLALCGWALCSDAIEILSVSFILPPATCEMKLMDYQKGWINSSIFLGMMVGGLIWGSLADSHGRRTILMLSLTVNALFGLASSLAQNFWQFIIFRFLSGVGVGGSMPVIFTYYAEFQPKEKRGSMISFLASFWMFGGLLAAVLAWAMIPYTFGVDTGHFKYNSWHIYLSICTIPSLTSAIFFFLMPESPRYLIETGRCDEAYDVFENIFLHNHRDLSSAHFHTRIDRLYWSENNMVSSRVLNTTSVHCNTVYSCFKLVGNEVFELFFSWKNMFAESLIKTTLIMITVFASLSFGYYGLLMWFPELFKKFDDLKWDNDGGSVCNLKNTTQHRDEVQCYPLNHVYRDGLIVTACNLPGNIITFFLVERIGRKFLLAGSMILSGISVFFIWFLNTRIQTLMMSCFFSGISIIGWNVLDVLSVEIFPTMLRSTASGLMTGIGRLAAICGNVMFGHLVNVNCAIPMLLVSVMLSGGGLLSFFLPNSRRTDLL